MSKSFDNYVSLEDDHREMFGKIMSIPDSLIVTYCDLLTDLSSSDVASIKEQLDTQSINPMVIKKQLSRDITTQFHGFNKARDAEDNFKTTVQLGKAPEDIAIANHGYEKETILSEFATIYFLVNQSLIRTSEKSDEDIEKLKEFAQLGYKTHSIEIKSFASPEGPVDANDDVSE